MIDQGLSIDQILSHQSYMKEYNKTWHKLRLSNTLRQKIQWLNNLQTIAPLMLMIKS